VKRLYKGLYGASWGNVATKNGIYEINEGYASVIKYPLDGSKKDGDSLYHSTYGNDEQPEVGIIQLAADDDGIVLALRTSDDDSKPGGIVALSPAGKNEKKLGEIPGGATALHIEGAKVYVGTKGGEVKVAARDGSGALTKVASGDGAVSSIVISGDDVFFATDKGIFVKRKGAANPDKLLGEGAGDLSIARDQLLFGQYQKGLSAMPLAGGQARLVFKIGAPVSTLFANNYVWLLDASLGKCHQEEEGNACPWEGAAFRIKF